MVDSIITESDPEPDIRPLRRINQVNTQTQDTNPRAAQHSAIDEQLDQQRSIIANELNSQPQAQDQVSEKNQHNPLVTTQTATSTAFTATSEDEKPTLARDYASVEESNNGSGAKPLRSILGVAARFRNKNSNGGLSGSEEYKSRSETDLGLSSKELDPLPTPTRSSSAAPTTRRTRTNTTDPSALHAHFDANLPLSHPPAHTTLNLPRPYAPNNVQPQVIDGMSRSGMGIRDIGPPRPPRNIAELFTPDRKVGRDPGWGVSLRNTAKSSYINYLLPIIPIAWALHFSHQSDVLVFVFTFIAVIPLASLLSFATEQLALRTGDAMGGLLNATFGNAVELLISILALVKGEIGLVQASMIGSILSNTLLVLGMCYFAGGLRFHEQLYAVNASQLQISLLGISTCALVLPAAYHFSVSSLRDTTAVEGGQITGLTSQESSDLLSISRGMAFMLLSVYVVYLVFVLYTHAYLFKRQKVSRKRPHDEPGQPHPAHDKVFPIPGWIDSIRSRGSSASSDSDVLSPTTTRDTIQPVHARTETTIPVDPEDIPDLERAATIKSEEEEDDEDEEKPQIKALWAFGLLVGVTGITGVTAEFLLDSINGLTVSTGISVEFVGLILLPLVGNSVEHVAAVTVSVKDKLNLSMAIAVGSSIQVSLALLPLLVLIGWAIGQPMSLFFDTFETITLAVSLLLVNFAIVDGRSNFCEGFVLMIAYAMIALVTWYYDPPH